MRNILGTKNLRIEIAELGISDYRVSDRDLEFRALDTHGQIFPDQRSTWKRVTANELLLHFRLETVVARWFLEKMAEWDAELPEAKLPAAA